MCIRDRKMPPAMERANARKPPITIPIVVKFRNASAVMVAPTDNPKKMVAAFILCNLITRFWDVQQGEIRIGGKNIKEIELEELMKLMSIVFQKVYLCLLYTSLPNRVPI